MSEIQGPNSAEYYEFDLGSFISHIAERQRVINETMFDPEDTELDEASKVEALSELATAVNTDLEVQGFLRQDVMTGPGTRIPRSPHIAHLLKKAILYDEPLANDGSDTLSNGSHRSVVGEYEGLIVFQEKFAEESITYTRPQLFHRILLGSDTIHDPYIEQSTQLYGYLPIVDENIQILKPGISYHVNERRLRGITGIDKIPNNEPAYLQFEAAFQAIIARCPPTELEKSLDWLYDQIQDKTRLLDEHVTLKSTGFLLQINRSEMYIWGNCELDGVVLGFGSIPGYRLDTATGNSIQIPDEYHLAIILEKETETEKCILKIPLIECHQARQQEDLAQ